ncbi:MAG: primosomal protein N' [Thermodesulfobacteriota bacterium]|nr:primosomal protein N' [Thermodesulfobacteriota bacterium]
MANEKDLACVAVSLPISKELIYRIPRHIKPLVQVGKQVLVPLKKRNITGYIIGFPEDCNDFALKDIIRLCDDIAFFDKKSLEFFRFISTYYFYPLGEVIKLALPKGINVESQRFVKISPEWKNDPPIQSLTIECREITDIISEKGAVSVKSLRIKKGIDNVNITLSLLGKKGIIETFYKEEKRTLDAKKEEIILPVTKDLKEISKVLQKTPQQRRVMEFIIKQKEATYSELKEHFPKQVQLIKKLKEKSLIIIKEKEVFRETSFDLWEEVKRVKCLTSQQEQVLKQIKEGMSKEKFASYLLHGVTGSGKTEIYIRATLEALKNGKESLILVPEIALTPQLIQRFYIYFSDKMAIFHSALSRRERYDTWRKVCKGLVKVIIGVRSAIFIPFPTLGLIVVDEEHETSYKQDDKLPYNARDLALVKGKIYKAAVLLGSATPSLESYYNQKVKKFTYLTLESRIEKRPLPSVAIVDMRKEKRKEHNKIKIFSELLLERIENCLLHEKQTILFLNRRGFSNFIICFDCGYAFRCRNCNVTLTFHANMKKLICHYCGYSIPAPPMCSNCKGFNLSYWGMGTEKVEQEIKNLFPKAKTIRLDRDTIINKDSYQNIIKDFYLGGVDILIGTQMIAKGLDIPNVTLVGVILADISLNQPDFRAGERTFQLLTQVSGRAGRGDSAGEVIIQTYNPALYPIAGAKESNYRDFYNEEIKHRIALSYPPACRLVNFEIMGTSKTRCHKYSAELSKIGKEINEKPTFKKNIEILGPVEAPLSKIKGKYRYHLLIKGANANLIHTFVHKLLVSYKNRWTVNGIGIKIDVDPQNLI